MRWSAQTVRRSTAARLASVIAVAGLWSAAASSPAAAQFSWFGQPEASAQDAYDTIASHGFRLTRPMMQNQDVYIADVIDRRMRRERLIISRQSGQVVQRFAIDTGRPGAYAALPGAPYGGPLPQRQRPDGDVFARIVRGFNDDAVPRPPADLDQPDRQDAVEPRTLPPSRRITRARPTDIDSRLATRRDDAPVTSRPLTPEPLPGPSAAPAPAPTAPSAARTPATPDETPQAAPQTVAPAPAPVQAAPAPSAPARATVVTTDPLRIPGTKDAEASRAATTAAAKPAAVAKPAPVKAPAGDVPVAPLD